MNYQEIIEKHIDAYDKECDKAYEKAIKGISKKIQPQIEKFCQKWGFDFFAGNTLWFLKLNDEVFSCIHSCFILGFLEPELLETLESEFKRWSIGSLMEPVKTQSENYEWVVIAFDYDECSPRILTLDEFNEIDTCLGNFNYFGQVTRQIAEFFIQLFDEDQEGAAIVFLECFPYA